MLFASSQILSRLFEQHYTNAAGIFTLIFMGAWLLIAAANMWVGVTRAGYSVAEEVPVFAIVAGLPLVVLLLVRWRFG